VLGPLLPSVAQASTLNPWYPAVKGPLDQSTLVCPPSVAQSEPSTTYKLSNRRHTKVTHVIWTRHLQSGCRNR
jgi:hypothetical protein